MKKMRIAMIGHKRIPGREGGIEVVVEELSTRMAQRGHRVTAFNRHKKGYISPKKYKGVRIIEIPTIEKKSTDAVVYSFLASIRVLFGKYDVIHYHAIGPSFFLMIPHLFRKKVIVTVHGLNYKTPKWKGFGARFIKAGEKIVAKYAEQIIVLSKAQKNYFKEKYNRETILIPNGTVIEELAEPITINKKYGLGKKDYILCVSRVVPGKGIEYLIDAYKKIPGELPLIIAGGTEYLDDYRNSIELRAKSDKRIRFIGHVEGRELRELYSNAKLFVFPSEAEGMPLCLLEALSFNCPSLVSDIPENVEMWPDYVATFESKNTNSLRNQLIKFLEDEIELKGNSRDYIQQKFSWERVVDKTLKCYKNILRLKQG